MKLILTLVSSNEEKSIMDILAQLATEALDRKRLETDPMAALSGGFGKVFKDKLIKGAAKTVDFIGGDVANSVFSMLKPTLGKVINDNLQQNKIPAAFIVEEIVKEGDKMKVTLFLDSISYAGVINRFLPEIIDSVREQDPANYMWRVYDVISDDQPMIVRAVLDTINNYKKNEIIGMMILQNKDVLSDKISGLLAAENIQIAIDDIDVIT